MSEDVGKNDPTLGRVPAEYCITSVEGHESHKQDLLSALDETHHVEQTMGSSSIMESDYFLEQIHKDYYEIIADSIIAGISKSLDFLYESKLEFSIKNYWYQRYTTNDEHDWHRHMGCDIAVVYYVELPDNAKPTILRGRGEENIEPDAEEGDILAFPAHIEHCSPKNKSDDEKTILAFNIGTNMSR